MLYSHGVIFHFHDKNDTYDNCNLETVMKTLMKLSKEGLIIIEISKILFNRLLLF